jgi:hypothetical protein
LPFTPNGVFLRASFLPQPARPLFRCSHYHEKLVPLLQTQQRFATSVEEGRTMDKEWLRTMAQTQQGLLLALERQGWVLPSMGPLMQALQRLVHVNIVGRDAGSSIRSLVLAQNYFKEALSDGNQHLLAPRLPGLHESPTTTSTSSSTNTSSTSNQWNLPGPDAVAQGGTPIVDAQGLTTMVYLEASVDTTNTSISRDHFLYGCALKFWKDSQYSCPWRPKCCHPPTGESSIYK